MTSYSDIQKALGDKAEYFLKHKAKISKERLHLPGSDWVDRIFGQSDRNIRVLNNLQRILDAGRQGPVISLFFLLIKASNTLQAPHLPKTPTTSTLKTSLNWRLMAGAMLLQQHSEHLALQRENMPIKSPIY